MEGERTIEVLVGNDAQNVSFNESFNGWDLVIDPKRDDSFTGEKKFLSLGVYDGETLYGSQYSQKRDRNRDDGFLGLQFFIDDTL